MKNKLIIFNPRSANAKHRIPNSILQVGAAIHGKYDYVFVDGNLEKNPLDVICKYLKTGDFGYFCSTVMPGPQLKQAIPFTKNIKEDFPNIKIIWGLGLKFQNFFLNRDKKLYKSFFSQTVKNDKETLEFVKKITNNKNINFKPILRKNKIQKDTVGIIIAASGIEKRWQISNYIEIINFLKKENFKKFLIISGMDQADDERIIKDKFNNELEFIFSSDKKIKDIIPYLKSCKFCVGNDTGFSHLSVNFDIETVIIYGDCPPQNYSNLIYNVDIHESVIRSATSIHSIKFDKVTKEILKLLNRRGGRVVEGARLESV